MTDEIDASWHPVAIDLRDSFRRFAHEIKAAYASEVAARAELQRVHPRDLHVVLPTAIAWAQSLDGEPPLLVVQLSTADEHWPVGLTRADAARLRDALTLKLAENTKLEISNEGVHQ